MNIRSVKLISSIDIEPLLGVMRPAIKLTIVVFPEPVFPFKPIILFDLMSKLTSFKI